ncbi:MAG: tetratricopeptide repeat protein, partial [Flavobacterium sp.]
MTTRLLTSFVLLFLIIACTDSQKSIDSEYYNNLISEYTEHRKPLLDNATTTKKDIAVKKVFEALDYLKQNDSVNAHSTALFKESITIVESENNLSLKLWVYSEVGFYYYAYNHYYKAAPYFIKISKILDNDSSVLEIQPISILMKTAYFFETMKKYDRSIAYYKKVLQLTENQNVNNSATLWSLGDSNLRRDSLSQAEKYFLLASKKALEYKDTLRHAKSLGGLALVYQKKGNKEKALSYFKEDISISKHLAEDRNLMYIQIQLGRFYFENRDYNLAEQAWKEAHKIADNKSYLMSFKREIIANLLQIAKIYKRDGEEL